MIISPHLIFWSQLDGTSRSHGKSASQSKCTFSFSDLRRKTLDKCCVSVAHLFWNPYASHSQPRQTEQWSTFMESSMYDPYPVTPSHLLNISGEATKSSWSIKSSIEKLIVGVKVSLLSCSRLMRKLKGKVSVRKSRQKGYCANFRYNFRLLDTSGWNFRHAHYHEEGRRTLYKAYGIKFVIIVQGRAGAGAVANRAGNVPSRSFTVPGEGPY